MAYTTVKDLFIAICDAIRSKTGTTEKISHQDIPAKINAIASGASGSGMTMKTGETTSNVINTGLSSVSAFVLYVGTISATGLVMATWENGKAQTVYCSSYSSYLKACATVSSETDVSVDGGIVTWNGASYRVMIDGETYDWIAVGGE